MIAICRPFVGAWVNHSERTPGCEWRIRMWILYWFGCAHEFEAPAKKFREDVTVALDGRCFYGNQSSYDDELREGADLPPGLVGKSRSLHCERIDLFKQHIRLITLANLLEIRQDVIHALLAEYRSQVDKFSGTQRTFQIIRTNSQQHLAKVCRAPHYRSQLANTLQDTGLQSESEILVDMSEVYCRLTRDNKNQIIRRDSRRPVKRQGAHCLQS